jgi:hypothetical protein
MTAPKASALKGRGIVWYFADINPPEFWLPRSIAEDFTLLDIVWVNVLSGVIWSCSTGISDWHSKGIRLFRAETEAIIEVMSICGSNATLSNYDLAGDDPYIVEEDP